MNLKQGLRSALGVPFEPRNANRNIQRNRYPNNEHHNTQAGEINEINLPNPTNYGRRNFYPSTAFRAYADQTRAHVFDPSPSNQNLQRVDYSNVNMPSHTKPANSLRNEAYDSKTIWKQNFLHKISEALRDL